MTKNTFEKGQIYQVPVEVICYDDRAQKQELKVPLRETKYFNVIYDRANHPKHFYLFSFDLYD